MNYNIDQNLKRYRIQVGLTQADLVKKLNISEPTISRIERNISIPGLESLISISKKLNVPLEYLVDNDSRDFKILASILFAQYIKESNEYETIAEAVKMVFDKNDKI